MSRPSTPKPISVDHPNIHVLIVGAGISGLTLANLLQVAGISYLVLEKASWFKPLGSAISLNCQTFNFLEQLGIYSDLVKVSTPFQDLNVHSLDTEKHPPKFTYRGTHNDGIDYEERFGFEGRMMSRPDLMEALLKRIPREKILLSKRVLSIQQNAEGVMCRTADGSSHHGDICVAADGCYSAVRQSMFRGIEKKNQAIPFNDKLPIQYNIDCCVGVTQPLNPIRYPAVAQEKCQFQVVLLKQEPVSIWYMPLHGYRMGWMINTMISKEKKSVLARILPKGNEEDFNNFKQTEWSDQDATQMCDKYRSLPTPFGTTLAELIDATPKQLISKVMLEEKYYETWTDGRTCLVGDACHKVLPFGAVGATNAMLDALALANRLFDLRDGSYSEIKKVLRLYHCERRDYGKAAVQGCANASKLFHNQGVVGDAMRKIALNHVPKWLIQKGIEKAIANRPQCTFLPFIQHTGSAPSEPQSYNERYLRRLQSGYYTFMSAQVDEDALDVPNRFLQGTPEPF